MKIIINLPIGNHNKRVIKVGLEPLLLLDPDVVQALTGDTPRQMGMEFLRSKYVNRSTDVYLGISTNNLW